MGRALLCAPYFSTTVLAATAIMNAGTTAQQEALLPPIALGETVATLARTPSRTGAGTCPGSRRRRWPTGPVSAWMGSRASCSTATPPTSSSSRPARRGQAAKTRCRCSRQPGDAPGLTRRALKALDPTRKLARLEFDGTPATLLGEVGGGAVPLAKTLTQAAACLASEMVGGAERLRVSALDYANLRMQFGRPIASFQSMKHKQADMLVDVELAKSAAYAAASAAAEDDPELPAIAALAKACASEAYLQTAIHTIQIHGGIGFTWDNDTHLWFKRAKGSEVFLGDPSWHRERMLQAWGA